jgi:hypothetical protein
MFSAEVLPQRSEFALAILMVGRLLEVTPEKSEFLKGWLRAHAARLLVYAYPDWSNEGLKVLAERAGLRLRQGFDRSLQAMATLN